MFQTGKINLIIPPHPANWNNFIWHNFDKIIYGPLDSRRLGKSLGINLFPNTKLCNFNCVYCDCGWTHLNNLRDNINFVNSETIKRNIEDELIRISKSKTRVDCITFAGNGEPTFHPDFPEILEFVYLLRNDLFPQTPIGIFTNGTKLYNQRVIYALNRIDRVMIKLDAADEETFNRVAVPIERNIFQTIITNMCKVKNFSLSTAVILGSRFSNFSSLNSLEYIKIIKKVKPAEIHLYTIDHPTPTQRQDVKRNGLDNEVVSKLLQLAMFISESCDIEIKAFTRRESCDERIK